MELGICFSAHVVLGWGGGRWEKLGQDELRACQETRPSKQLCARMGTREL